MGSGYNILGSSGSLPQSEELGPESSVGCGIF